MIDLRIINADVLDGLAEIESDSVQCVVTSPPYWGLRDYGIEGQIGLEATPEKYVEKMVKVFAEVRRVLRDDGTLWMNLGDSYNAGRNGGHPGGAKQASLARHAGITRSGANAPGLKPKDLVGIPWRVAFALQADGWYLRSDIIWHKPNPMPESVTDRPTKAHEYVFLMAKSARYYYDAGAISERSIYGVDVKDYTGDQKNNSTDPVLQATRIKNRKVVVTPTRNARTVWTIPTEPYPEAHFATFPTALAERCIRAGSRTGDTVLDPFAGSGTTLAVARGLGRSAVGIEINPEYVKLIEKRCALPWERTTADEQSEQKTLFDG